MMKRDIYKKHLLLNLSFFEQKSRKKFKHRDFPRKELDNDYNDYSHAYLQFNVMKICFNPLSLNPTKWSNTL